MNGGGGGRIGNKEMEEAAMEMETPTGGGRSPDAHMRRELKCKERMRCFILRANIPRFRDFINNNPKGKIPLGWVGIPLGWVWVG